MTTIQFRNYFGNEIFSINFVASTSDNFLLSLEDVAGEYGYDVDKEDSVFILTEANVDNSLEEAKEDLLKLVSEITKFFI